MKKLLCLLMFCATSVWAQTPPAYDFFKVPEGTEYQWETESGTATGTVAGRTDGLQEVLIAQSADEGRVQSIYVNSAGQVLRMQLGAFSMSFDPHDCSRQLGACAKIITTPLGETVGVETTAIFDNGTWIYQFAVDSPGYEFLIEKECKIYDAQGVVLASAAITFGGAMEWQRRISQGYDQSSRALLKQARDACGFAAFEGV